MRFLTSTVFFVISMCVWVSLAPFSFAQPSGKASASNQGAGGAGKEMAGGGRQAGGAFGKPPGGFQGRNHGRITDPSTARPGAAPGINHGLELGKHPGNYQGRISGKITDPSTARTGMSPGAHQSQGLGSQPGNYQGGNRSAPSNPHTAKVGAGGPSTPQVPKGPSTESGTRTPANFKKRDLGQMSPRKPGKPLNPDDAVSSGVPNASTSSRDSMPSEALPRVQEPSGLHRLGEP